MQRRNTRQKQIILDEVQSRCDHPTAEQIYEAVRKRNKNISRGTVYRNLSVLAENNQIKNICLPEMNHYDLRTDSHCHFVCRNCKRVFDINIEYNKSYDNRKLSDGFLIETHETFFRGVCPECLHKINFNSEEKV